MKNSSSTQDKQESYSSVKIAQTKPITCLSSLQYVSHVQVNKKMHLFLVIIIPLLHRKQKKEEEAKEGGREPAAKSNTFHH